MGTHFFLICRGIMKSANIIDIMIKLKINSAIHLPNKNLDEWMSCSQYGYINRSRGRLPIDSDGKPARYEFTQSGSNIRVQRLCERKDDLIPLNIKVIKI